MSARSYPAPPSLHYAQTVSDLPRLDGRTVAITGSTSGTGEVFARTAGALGARIVALNRPSQRATNAVQKLRAAGVDVVDIDCDLQSFDSVRQAGPRVLEACPEGVDVLCNNAGVMGLADQATVDGCDVQMQTNHLSHFLLTSLLWPAIRTAAETRGESRIVNHSSGARRGPALETPYLERNGGNLGGDRFPGFGKWRRYQQSKLANLLFTYALSDHLPEEDKARGIKAVTAHPGPTNSGLQAKTANAGGTGLLDRYILRRTLRVAHSTEDGALGIIRASLDPNAADGDFFGPAGPGKPGPPVLLPAERDQASQNLLWTTSKSTTGVNYFFNNGR